MWCAVAATVAAAVANVTASTMCLLWPQNFFFSLSIRSMRLMVSFFPHTYIHTTHLNVSFYLYRLLFLNFVRSFVGWWFSFHYLLLLSIRIPFIFSFHTFAIFPDSVLLSNLYDRCRLSHCNFMCLLSCALRAFSKSFAHTQYTHTGTGTDIRSQQQ